MPKIYRLDDLTINQIAAGEVVERPVSAVKELVENALDAGAANITVEMRQGGLAYLKVSDDGCGMSEQDTILAIQRHATSKLRTLDDLNTVYTLGFRGEALPSIISVAKVEIISREAGAEHGTKLVCSGGQAPDIEPAGAPVGTSVVVSDLFFNTPARRNFMRSESYEGGLIHERMIQFALGHPQVNFRLLSQGKEILNTAGIGTIPDLLELFYGNTVKEALLAMNGPVSKGQVAGYLTSPVYHRANRRGIHLYINNRRVLSRELLTALEEAYEAMLPKGQFPLAVLHITMDSSLLDVNVHPSKLEIRLRDNQLGRCLAELAEQVLRGNQQAPVYTLSPLEPSGEESRVEEPRAQYQPAPVRPAGQQQTWQEFFTRGQPLSTTAKTSLDETNEIVSVSDLLAVSSETEEKKGLLPELRILGQIADTYIAAEGNEGLYLIDQHVAHERVIYDRLTAQSSEGNLAAQVLLLPVNLQLTALEEEMVIRHIMPLTDLGIILEHFGPRSYLLRAIPASLGPEADPGDFFFSLLDQLEERNKTLTPADIKREVMTLSSCKGAVKAGQKLSASEMAHLIREFSATAASLTCPHGRPIIHVIPFAEINKAFHRS